MNAQRFLRLVVVSGGLIFLPATAWAQAETGTIAGVVRDASGAVIPGARTYTSAFKDPVQKAKRQEPTNVHIRRL